MLGQQKRCNTRRKICAIRYGKNWKKKRIVWHKSKEVTKKSRSLKTKWYNYLFLETVFSLLSICSIFVCVFVLVRLCVPWFFVLFVGRTYYPTGRPFLRCVRRRWGRHNHPHTPPPVRTPQYCPPGRIWSLMTRGCDNCRSV